MTSAGVPPKTRRDEEQLQGEVGGHVAESLAFTWPM